MFNYTECNSVELKQTFNKTTHKFTYYRLDEQNFKFKRISEDEYDFLRIYFKRVSCISGSSDKVTMSTTALYSN